MTHPARRLTAPDGTQADIDIGIAPLIEVLWEAGYDTIGSCQDVGENLKDHPRQSAYWKGYALLEMPVNDACRLIDFIKRSPEFFKRMHWATEGAWEMHCPVLPWGLDGGPAEVIPWVQIRFPNNQVDDLIEVIQSQITATQFRESLRGDPR